MINVTNEIAQYQRIKKSNQIMPIFVSSINSPKIEFSRSPHRP